MNKSENILKNKMESITCHHCQRIIVSPALEGLTLICPYCKRSVNGQYYHKFINNEQTKKFDK